MDQERIQGQTATEEADKLSIMDILMVLRSRWLIILIITVLFAVGGYVYARSRKPVFTASVPVTFKTTVEQVEKDESGEYKTVQDGVSSTNYLYAYLDTAVEFCVSGNVLDRTNFYYAKYEAEKAQDETLTIDGFVSKLKGIYDGQKEAYKGCIELYAEASDKYNSLVEYYKSQTGRRTIPEGAQTMDADTKNYATLSEAYEALIGDYEELRTQYLDKDFTNFPVKPISPEKTYEIAGYELTDKGVIAYRNSYITAGKAGTTNATRKKDEQFSSVQFSLTVKDYDGNKAKELARVYALAADVALNEKLQFDSRSEAGAIATAGIYEMVKNSGGVSLTSDSNKTKTVVIATFLGIVVSLLVVYVSYIADTTVKTRETLEKLTGTSVIAYIDDVGENK